MKPLDITFTVTNVVGIILYLRLAARGWRISEEHGMVPVTGEPFVWILAVPVFAVFLLVNIVWGGLLLYSRQSKGARWWLVIAAVWLLAIGIDFSHH